MSPYRYKIYIVTGLLATALPHNAQAFDLFQALSTFQPTTATTSSFSLKSTGLSRSEMVLGLKDALRIGSEHVVSQLGKQNGFYNDKAIHIPLPDNLKSVKSAISMLGMEVLLDDLERRLNRSAEAATPKAKVIFKHAITEMKLHDAQKILNGSKHAATDYFKKKMSRPLSQEIEPVIQQALAQQGAIEAYQKVMKKYHALPFMPDIQSDLTQHVIDLTLKGIFHYMAKEEADIRKNPLKRTTKILKKVFKTYP
ncbi:MAG: DUF4197 domain-containing protein [Mariprofundaceae bacterium]